MPLTPLYNIRFPDGSFEYRSFGEAPSPGERIELAGADWIVETVDESELRFEVRRPGARDLAGARAFDPWAAT